MNSEICRPHKSGVWAFHGGGLYSIFHCHIDMTNPLLLVCLFSFFRIKLFILLSPHCLFFKDFMTGHKSKRNSNRVSSQLLHKQNTSTRFYSSTCILTESHVKYPVFESIQLAPPSLEVNCQDRSYLLVAVQAGRLNAPAVET